MRCRINDKPLNCDSVTAEVETIKNYGRAESDQRYTHVVIVGYEVAGLISKLIGEGEQEFYVEVNGDTYPNLSLEAMSDTSVVLRRELAKPQLDQ